MKYRFVFACLVAFIVSDVTAQVKREVSPSQSVQADTMRKNKKKEMMRTLNLTKEQRAQMKEFHQSMKENKEAISGDQTLTDLQKKEKLKELHKVQKEKINSILTPEQKEKMMEQKRLEKA